MAEWFAEIFDERYLAFYEELLDTAVAEEDAGFVDRALALAASSRVLDVGCGFGRHAVALARRGHRVTGLDLSEPMLKLAAELARGASVAVEWLRRDMRELVGLGPFDACICLYTAFGFFLGIGILPGSDLADRRDSDRGERDRMVWSRQTKSGAWAEIAPRSARSLTRVSARSSPSCLKLPSILE